MEGRKIEVKFYDMVKALTKAVTKEPLKDLVEKEPIFMLLFPGVLKEVWDELASEHTEEEEHE